MITCTITNESSTASIGNNTATPLPGPFAWMVIAASSSGSAVARVQDLLAQDRLTGYTIADELQQMVQMGLITISFANLAATMAPDASGDAVAAQTT